MWDIIFHIAQLIVHNKVFVSRREMFFFIVYDLSRYHVLCTEVRRMYIRQLNSHESVVAIRMKFKQKWQAGIAWLIRRVKTMTVLHTVCLFLMLKSVNVQVCCGRIAGYSV